MLYEKPTKCFSIKTCIPINIESTHHIPETNTILCQLHYNYKKEQVSPNQRVSFLNGL